MKFLTQKRLEFYEIEKSHFAEMGISLNNQGDGKQKNSSLEKN